jgi:drug/metabolite transporter (DMT)-like permease
MNKSFMPERGPSGTHKIIVGMGWVVLGGLLFTGFTAIARHVGRDLPPIETAFLRYALGMVTLIPIFLRRGVSLLRTKHPVLHIARGTIHGIAVLLWFVALAYIPLAEVMALGFIAPIFVTLGAFIFLGESLRLRRVLAIAVGLLGVLLILRPGIASIHPGAIAMLVAAPLFAASKLITKQLVASEDGTTIVTYLNVCAAVTILIPALFIWRTPTWEELSWLTLAAILATLSHLAIIRALRLIDLTVMQPAEFLQLIWATLIGFYIFSEQPSLWVFAGGIVIVASASYIAHREARQLRGS